MAALMQKGSFSYLQDDVHFVRLDAETMIRIERLHDTIARVYLVDNNQVQQAVPNHII